jgi:hypothetical protein
LCQAGEGLAYTRPPTAQQDAAREQECAEQDQRESGVGRGDAGDGELRILVHAAVLSQLPGLCRRYGVYLSRSRQRWLWAFIHREGAKNAKTIKIRVVFALVVAGS